MFIKELGDRITVIPYFANYDCIAWTHKYSNSAKIFQHFFEGSYDDYTFSYEYIINGETCIFTGSLEFLNLELDPEFDEGDELQRAKLHSVDLSFQIKAFTFSGQGVQLADGAILEMFYNGEFEHTVPDPPTGTG